MYGPHPYFYCLFLFLSTLKKRILQIYVLQALIRPLKFSNSMHITSCKFKQFYEIKISSCKMKTELECFAGWINKTRKQNILIKKVYTLSRNQAPIFHGRKQFSSNKTFCCCYCPECLRIAIFLWPHKIWLLDGRRVTAM